MDYLKIQYKGESFDFSPEVGLLNIHPRDPAFTLSLKMEGIVFEIVEQPLSLKWPRPADLFKNIFEIRYENQDDEDLCPYASIFAKEWVLTDNRLFFSETNAPSLVSLEWSGKGRLMDSLQGTDEISFRMKISLSIKPGYWQCDFESKGDLYVESLHSYQMNGDERLFLDFMTQKIRSKSSSVILFNTDDESVIHTFGNAQMRIMECGLWVHGIYEYYTVLYNTESDILKKLYYDEVNSIEVPSNEILSDHQTIHTFSFFMYRKALPEGYTLIKKEKYRLR